MSKPNLLLAALVTSSIGAAQTSYPPVHYDPIDLGTLGGALSRGHEVHGIITATDRATVGEAQDASGELRPFLHADGLMQDLGTFGGPSGSAASMSLFGVVVGHADAPGQTAEFPRAFRWRATSGLEDLGDLGGGRSWATAIDPYDETICGHSSLPSGDVHAFFLDAQGGAMVDIGTLGGSTSFGEDVDSQVVVGGALTASGQMHAFTWNSWSGMTDLGTLGGSLSRAFSTSLGRICGVSMTATGGTHPFYMPSPSEPMLDLGTLGGTIGAALNVNGFGQVVGYAEDSAGHLRAFYWDHYGQEMQDLNDLIPEHSGWDLQAATHISEYGFISGYGLHHGEPRAFMLRPFRLSVVGFAGSTNDLKVLFCAPHEPIFFAWSLTGSGACAPGFVGGANGFGGLHFAGRTLATDWGPAMHELAVPASVSGTTVYFRAVAPNRRLSSPVVAKSYF